MKNLRNAKCCCHCKFGINDYDDTVYCTLAARKRTEESPQYADRNWYKYESAHYGEVCDLWEEK